MTTENIAKDATAFISPYMPYFAKESLASAKNIDDESFERAQSLWKHVKFKFQANAVSRRLIRELEDQPYNQTMQNLFQYQLSQLVKEDGSLALQVQQILHSN